MNTIISTLFLSCMIFICLMHAQTNAAASKSIIINFTNLSPDNLPDKPVKLRIDKTLKVRSFCIRFYVAGTAYYQSIFTNKDGFNGVLELSINFPKKYGFVLKNGKRQIFKMCKTPVPFMYNHFCFTHNQTDYAVAENGEICYTNKISEEDVPKMLEDSQFEELHFGKLSPNLTVAGNYFLGKVSELVMLNDSLNFEQLVNISGGCHKIDRVGKIFDWSALTQDDFEVPDQFDIRLSESRTEDICPIRSSKSIDVLPFSMDNQHANIACKTLGGEMFLPENDYDIQEMNDKIQGDHELLKSMSCKKSFWIPLFKANDLKTWVSLNNRSMSVDRTYAIANDGKELQRCAYYLLYKHFYGDATCDLSFCTYCIWKIKTTFRIRGLCNKADIEERYVLLNYFHHNGLIAFYGYSKNSIIYDSKYKSWVIIDTSASTIDFEIKKNDYKVLAVYTPTLPTSYLPTGLQYWDVRDPECNGTRKLMFTSCNYKQFTCHDGTCIKLSRRCNGLFDCDDESDEDNCKKVSMNELSYKKGIPPFLYGLHVKIEVAIFLLDVNKIELPSRFNVKMQLVLIWNDYRLTFYNLQKSGNIIDFDSKYKIWIPQLTFSNTEDNMKLINDYSTSLTILQRGPYKRNTRKEKHEGTIFKGDENFIKYSREYKLDLLCSYNLINYPFDTQICTIDVAVPEHYKKYMHVIANQTANRGVSKLDQFDIMKVDIRSFDNLSVVKCLIHLRRDPTYHIASTYLPTVCILVMALMTLFIDKSHFEATIMVALTAMLVMYTLFQGIAASMPSTSYMKLLDYWLLFGLVMPFGVFIVLVVWELIDQDSNKKAVTLYGTRKIRKSDRSGLQKAKCIIPTVTITFVLGYALVAGSIYVKGTPLGSEE